MKAKQLIAAVAVFAAAGSAFAGEAPYFAEFGHYDNFKSTLTRAEVRHELAQAYANGELNRNTEFVEQNIASTRSRDDVRREATQSVRGHQVSDIYFGG